eukprot:6228631-Alexandrium_andersonii.AAC.1
MPLRGACGVAPAGPASSILSDLPDPSSASKRQLSVPSRRACPSRSHRQACSALRMWTAQNFWRMTRMLRLLL